MAAAIRRESMSTGNFKMTDLMKMTQDELLKFAQECVKDAQANAEIIRQLQNRVDVQVQQLQHVANEKNSIAAVRDKTQMKLDVYMMLVDELLEKILKARGY